MNRRVMVLLQDRDDGRVDISCHVTPAPDVGAEGYEPTPAEQLGAMLFDAARDLTAAAPEPRCRECGCTEISACMIDSAPCGWAEDDLCTGCAGIAI